MGRLEAAVMLALFGAGLVSVVDFQTRMPRESAPAAFSGTSEAPVVPAPLAPEPEKPESTSLAPLAPRVSCSNASGSVVGASLETSLVKVAGELFWMRHHLHDRLMDKVIAGDYESFLFSNVKPFLHTACTIKRGNVIDVGANHGVYTLLAASMGCTAFAYEIQPRLTPLIQYSACVNRLDNSVVVRPFAVGSTPGFTKFTATDARGNYEGAKSGAKRETGWLGAYVNKGSKVAADDPNAVQIVTLDEEATKLGIKWVDVFKLDVDGFEVDAINGAWQLLARTSFFQFEINAGDWRSSSTSAAYVATLVRLSKMFRLFLLKPRGQATGKQRYGHLYPLCPDSRSACFEGFVEDVSTNGNDNVFCIRAP
mmetsp:Transcript_59325/g.132349  ORF Transcript_59325/g.132349 Transcript_59325/m.132349 type:complete len:368 (+) Transcript_59325:76-1179(+)